MARRLAALLGVAVLALALGVAVTSAAPDKRASKTVKVGDDFFSPTSLSVSKGTKVKFNWIGSDKHNVIKKKGPGADFASPTTASTGVHLSQKFNKAGTYKIICTIHPDMKMTLNVH